MDTNANNRFANLEIDDGAPVVAAPPAPVATPIVLQAWEGEGRNGEIDAEGRARALAGAAVAERAGLAFSEPTFFVAGTRGAWGDAAKRARLKLEARPTLIELASEAREIVKAEGRRGDVVTIDKLTYGTDDRLRTRVGSEGAIMSPQAIRQLAARCDASGGGYLSQSGLTGALRAPHMAHWIGQAVSADKGTDGEGKIRSLKVLSKLTPKGNRAAYGMVGKNYPHDYGMDRVISDLSSVLPTQSRAALTYDSASTKWRVDAAIGAPVEVTVGEIHRLGVKFGAHDAGGGAYYAELYGIRVRCLNFSAVQLSKKLGRVRHIGTAEGLRERILALVAGADEVMREYAEVYRQAHEEALAADHSPSEVFAAMIKQGYISVPSGEDAALTLKRLVSAWEVEPMRTRAGYHNAITRAAHEAAWSSPWATDELEAQAGKILYQGVTLAPSVFESL